MADTQTVKTKILSEDAGILVSKGLVENIRVMSEYVPGMLGTTIGVWVRVGSMDEDAVTSGISHFLEHLLFKGTEKYTGEEIGKSIERMGGGINAFTSTEYTCYYVEVPNEGVEKAVDILSGMVSSATLIKEDIDNERGVVLEEIARRDDNYFSIASLNISQRLYGNTPLKNDVLGSRENIERLSAETISTYYHTWYHSSNMVVVAVGGSQHEKIIEYVEKYFGRVNSKSTNKVRKPSEIRAVAEPGVVFLEEENTGQAYVIFGVPGYLQNDEKYFASEILSTIIGESMSSRLDQKLRQTQLAGWVGSWVKTYESAGELALVLETSTLKQDEAVKALYTEISNLIKNGVTQEEVETAKGRFRGRILLGSESHFARMFDLGSNEITNQDFIGLNKKIEQVDKVNVEMVNKVAEELLSKEATVCILGPTKEKR